MSFSNISLRNIKGDAILVRLSAPGKTYRKDAVVKKEAIKDLMFAQIQGARISDHGNAISGVPGQIIENVVLRDISLEFTGGGLRSSPPAPAGKRQGLSGDQFVRQAAGVRVLRAARQERRVREREPAFRGG